MEPLLFSSLFVQQVSKTQIHKPLYYNHKTSPVEISRKSEQDKKRRFTNTFYETADRKRQIACFLTDRGHEVILPVTQQELLEQGAPLCHHLRDPPDVFCMCVLACVRACACFSINHLLGTCPRHRDASREVSCVSGAPPGPGEQLELLSLAHSRPPFVPRRGSGPEVRAPTQGCRLRKLVG